MLKGCVTLVDSKNIFVAELENEFSKNEMKNESKNDHFVGARSSMVIEVQY